MKVLVTNPTYRNTTAIVRALGRRGARVEVVGLRDRAGRAVDGQAFHSRYCSKRHFARDPRRDLEGFIDDLAGILESGRFDVLLPVGTNAVIPCSKHAARIRSLAPFPFPDYDKVELAHDKGRMTDFAEEAGVGVPRTVRLDAGADARTAAEALRFPVVVKARKGAGSSGVFVARTPDALGDALDALRRRADGDGVRECFDPTEPLLQEYVAGPIYDVGVLVRDGEVLAHVVQRRERTLPVEGGSGMINRTCDHDAVRDDAFRLMRSLRWTGVGQVELKLDGNGRPRLMEFNPKFWGTLDLSIRAGVDFPWLACLLATGRAVPATDYRRGLRYRWLVPDGVRTVMASPDRLVAAWAFFSPFCLKTVSEVRLGDLGPLRFYVRRLLRS